MTANANELFYADAMGVPVHQDGVRRGSSPMVSRYIFNSHDSHGVALGNVSGWRPSFVADAVPNKSDVSQFYQYNLYGHRAPRNLLNVRYAVRRL